MSYSDDLKHPRWQERRLQVFHRAGFRCERCACAERQLHAHHKIYLRGRKPWDYPDALLECLCDTCHTSAHAHKEQLELLVAKHPTSMLPTITKLMDRLGAVMTSHGPQQRVDAVNALQDELDAMEDLERGIGGEDPRLAA